MKQNDIYPLNRSSQINIPTPDLLPPISSWNKAPGRGGNVGLFVTAALLFGAVSLAVDLPELGFSLFSMALFAGYARWLIISRNLGIGLLLITFLLGCIASWVIGFLGYCYVLPWRGLDTLTMGRSMTAVLVLVALIGACFGGWIAIQFGRKQLLEPFLVRFSREELLTHLISFGALFIVYGFLWVTKVGLNARWELGSVYELGSGQYWVAGFRCGVVFPFYALLGISLTRSILSSWNLGVGAILLACALFNSLTGGRESAIEPVVLCGAGALFSRLPWRSLAKVGVLALPPFILTMVIIGRVRDPSLTFAGGSISDKIFAIEQVVTGTAQYSDNNDSDPYYLVFSRIFEPSAQVVIDKAYLNGPSFGWANFDRLPYTFVPQFLYPGKLPLNDGWERLVLYHGYNDSTFASCPMTIIADTYERFGIPGVLGFHIVIGIVLVFLNRLVLLLQWKLLAVLLIVCFAKASLRIYAESFLGFVSATFYGFLRDTIIISLIFFVGQFFCATFGSPREIRSAVAQE